MFLPVLLVRDFGVWGFVVFAVPNVIGAAAMGFVLRTPEVSRAILERHRIAVACFSAITAVFQIVFLFSITMMFFGSEKRTHLAIACALGVAAVAVALKRWGAALIWGGSLALLVLAWKGSGFALPKGGSMPTDLMFLAPVCAFGFALCPYLDGTFHRARIELGSASRMGFAVGFGVLFLTMILGTLSYAVPVGALFQSPELVAVMPSVMLLIGAHIAMQAAYTTLLHVPVVYASRPSRFVVLVFFGALIVGAGLAAFAWFPSPWGMTIGEVVYRLFMSFYGLVFPAYVWLCMIPTRDGHSGIGGAIGRRKLVVLAVAVAIAGPCYWLGFIVREEMWLAPGVLIVLLSRLLVRGKVERSQP